MSINDASVGRSVDEAIRLVQAFKFVDENGVCPINWKPGSKAINVHKKEEYFKSLKS
ncbi:hypothetical protein MXB_4318 [Myxobolus squamalis]|nr:hypothetical protein MXB_4318 [Myxobolus squamalis]